LDDAEIPKGITRTIVIFVLALALSYAVAAIVEWIVS
jgi:hypothetical protein